MKKLIVKLIILAAFCPVIALAASPEGKWTATVAMKSDNCNDLLGPALRRFQFKFNVTRHSKRFQLQTKGEIPWKMKEVLQKKFIFTGRLHQVDIFGQMDESWRVTVRSKTMQTGHILWHYWYNDGQNQCQSIYKGVVKRAA